MVLRKQNRIVITEKEKEEVLKEKVKGAIIQKAEKYRYSGKTMK